MSHSQRIYKLFQDNPDKWFSTAEVFKLLESDGVPKTSVYNTLSNFSIKEPKYLLRRESARGAGSEYAFNANAPKFVGRPERRQVAPRQTTGSKTHRLPYILWDDAEKLKMAAEYLKVEQERPHIPSTEAVQLMMNVLPLDRRRSNVRKLQDVPWLSEFVQKARRMSEFVQNVRTQADENLDCRMPKIDPTPVDQPPPVPVQNPKEDVLDQIARLDRERTEREGAVVKPLGIEAFSLDDLVNEVAGRIGAKISAKIKSSVLEALTSEEIQNALKFKTDINVHHTHDTKTAEAKEVVRPDTRPKALILGLRKDHQIDEVKRDYSGHVNISFALPEMPISQIRHQVQQNVAVYFVIDNVNYRHANNIRDAGIKFTRIDGGIGTLRHRLTEDFQKYKFL